MVPVRQPSSSFKEEFAKFKSEKERSPGFSIQKEVSPPKEDFTATEIRWLNELRGADLPDKEKINLLENEIINLLDMNNEVKSELEQMKAKYAAMAANVKKVCGFVSNSEPRA